MVSPTGNDVGVAVVPGTSTGTEVLSTGADVVSPTGTDDEAVVPGTSTGTEVLSAGADVVSPTGYDVGVAVVPGTSTEVVPAGGELTGMETDGVLAGLVGLVTG